MNLGLKTEGLSNPQHYAYRAWLLFSLISFLLLFALTGAIEFDNILAWSVGLLYVVYDTWLLSYVAWKTRILGKITTINSTELITNEQHLKRRNTSLSLGVLVAVYNESNEILPTLKHLLAQDHTPKKIIIVNDGSIDDTENKINQLYSFYNEHNKHQQSLFQSKLHPHLYLYNKKNSGKADSLNQAIAYIDCDVIVTVDADTLLAANALKEIQNSFANNNKLVASCGILTPRISGNKFSRIIGTLQYFEYLRAFLSRAAWSQSNALLLVSGAFSAYKKQALTKVGGYDTSSLVEDYELIHRMHKYAYEHGLNWQIDVIEKALATTDAPADVFTFIQQRKRWFAGFLITQFKYRHMIGMTKYNNVGRFMLPIKTVDTLQPIFGLFALYLLIDFTITDTDIATHVLIVILVKLLIDLCFHLWSLSKYHDWLGESVTHSRWWQALFCCLLDPFFFQPLRHISALIGWTMIFRKNARWETIRITPNNYNSNK
jgi:cellulose synthase/poly-beta-1,6-N-acetylglucosamine synthase-like glycosyltransferase